MAAKTTWSRKQKIATKPTWTEIKKKWRLVYVVKGNLRWLTDVVIALWWISSMTIYCQIYVYAYLYTFALAHTCETSSLGHFTLNVSYSLILPLSFSQGVTDKWWPVSWWCGCLKKLLKTRKNLEVDKERSWEPVVTQEVL